VPFIALEEARQQGLGNADAAAQHAFIRGARDYFFKQMGDALNGNPGQQLCAQNFAADLGLGDLSLVQLQAAFAGEEIATSQSAHKMFGAAHKLAVFYARNTLDAAYAASPAGMQHGALLSRTLGLEKPLLPSDDETPAAVTPVEAEKTTLKDRLRPTRGLNAIRNLGSRWRSRKDLAA
jgi:hypothetical protein